MNLKCIDRVEHRGTNTEIDPKKTKKGKRGFPDVTGIDFIMYNATDKTNMTQNSGFNRRPLLLDALKSTADGWFEGVVTPVKGWTLPKFTTTI